MGAGIMGTNHARLAPAVRDATVTCIADTDPDRAARLAASVGAEATSIDGIADHIDAAVVAVPSELHLDVGLELMKAGIHVLVEKPLATTIEDAEAMAEAAELHGVTLMAGHVERFNPAVLELDRLLGDVVHVAAARISPFSPRIPEDVVTDLMIHDLDVVRSIARCPVVDVECMAMCVRSEVEDLASALIRFENGMTANLTASRVGQQKIRELRITQADAYVTLDLVRQDVTINRVEHEEFLSEEGARYRQSGMVEIPFLEHQGEPLLLELQEFVRAVSTGTAPRVTAEDGVEALRLVARVKAAARRAAGTDAPGR
ncbi:MAG TPA: Gfo/Idh/MocA family oxidoreductase [Acidimicrobiia bacterium]